MTSERNCQKLYEAIRSIDLLQVHDLLNLVDLDAAEAFWPAGDPPLVLAAKVGREISLIRALVSQQCPANATSSTGETALHCVASLWEADTLAEVVKILLEAGCDPGLTDNLRRQLPLHLLAKRCSNNKKQSGHTSDSVVEALRHLAESGCDINAKDHTKRTALHFLASSHCSRPDPYHILLSRGADISSQNDRGETPLLEALEGGSLFAAELILTHAKAGVVLEDASGKHRDVRAFSEQRGADWLLKATLYGETALHVAARKDFVHIVELILQVHGDPQLTGSRDLNGDTALHLAAGRGHLEVVRALVSSKCIDINARNRKGLTPLHVAVESGFIPVVKMLLETPACDVLARTSDERKSSAFDLAQHEYRRRSQPEMSIILMREAERRNLAVR